MRQATTIHEAIDRMVELQPEREFLLLGDPMQ